MKAAERVAVVCGVVIAALGISLWFIAAFYPDPLWYSIALWPIGALCVVYGAVIADIPILKKRT
jgi:hypothetical protein